MGRCQYDPRRGGHPNTTHYVQPKRANDTVKIQNKGHFCLIHEVVSVALNRMIAQRHGERGGFSFQVILW